MKWDFNLKLVSVDIELVFRWHGRRNSVLEITIWFIYDQHINRNCVLLTSWKRKSIYRRLTQKLKW